VGSSKPQHNTQPWHNEQRSHSGDTGSSKLWHNMQPPNSNMTSSVAVAVTWAAGMMGGSVGVASQVHP